MADFHFRLTPTHAHLLEGSARVVDRLLCIPDPAAAKNSEYKLRLWDGLIHFFDRDTSMLPQGLLPRLTKRLNKRGHKVCIVEDPPAPFIPPVASDYLIGIDMSGPFAFQLAAVNTGFTHKRGMWWLATNAGKSGVTAAFTGAIARAGYKALVIVPNKYLLHQTANDIKKYLGPDVTVSMIGDGMRQMGAMLTVATYQTLIQGVPSRTSKPDRALLALLQEVTAVVVDEGHHCAASGLQDILNTCTNATYRIGGSGSFDKTDKSIERGDEKNAAAVAEQWRMEAILGPILARVRNEDLIALGVSAKPTIITVTDITAYGPPFPTPKPPPPMDGPPRRFDPYRPVFTACAINDKRFRRSVAQIAAECLRQGKAPFVFSHSVEQLVRLKKTFDFLKVPCEMVSGKDPMSRRTEVVKSFKKRGDFAVLASNIFAEGASIPEIRAVIFAGARKSPVELLQRIGRGLRKKAGGDNSVCVFDFAMLNSTLLNKHFRSRRASYVDEGFDLLPLARMSELGSLVL